VIQITAIWSKYIGRFLHGIYNVSCEGTTSYGLQESIDMTLKINKY